MLAKEQEIEFYQQQPGQIAERKWDGFRGIIDGRGAPIVYNRNHTDYTERLPELREASEQLSKHGAVVDVEFVVLDNPERENFTNTGRRCKTSNMKKQAAMIPHMKIHAKVFDLIYFMGNSTKHLTLAERRTLLETLMSKIDSQYISIVKQYTDVEAALQLAIDNKWEGLIVKDLNGIYVEGARNWIKLKLSWEEEFMVVGHTPSKVNPFRAMVIADHNLNYVCKCGQGMTEPQRKELMAHHMITEQSTRDKLDIPLKYEWTPVKPFPVMIKHYGRLQRGYRNMIYLNTSEQHGKNKQAQIIGKTPT